MEQVYIIKIGGNVIDDEGNLRRFLKGFSNIIEPKVLVHGGGKIATQMGQKLGIEPNLIDGRRITDAATLQLVTMVYGGLINKNLTTLLQSYGCNALGMTGADASIISAKRREIKNNIDYGFVGDITEVAGKRIFDLLALELTPVCAPLTHDGEGQLLNTNADTIASAIAQSMAGLAEVHLIYCFELKGVLADFEDKSSVISDMNQDLYHELKSNGKIAKGMIPKLDNAFDALKAGVMRVTICHADELPALIAGEKTGTSISL